VYTSDTDNDKDGLTLEGIAHVMVFVFFPIEVLPLNVSIVNIMLTLVPVVFCNANDTGGVQDTLELFVFVATVPEVLPHLYVMVCVKLSSSLLMVNVWAVPSVPLEADRLLIRAMLGKVPLPEPDFVPICVPLKVMSNS
jgi:hypothetical protein